jgi:hypothetical protein
VEFFHPTVMDFIDVDKYKKVGKIKKQQTQKSLLPYRGRGTISITQINY